MLHLINPRGELLSWFCGTLKLWTIRLWLFATTKESLRVNAIRNTQSGKIAGHCV